MKKSTKKPKRWRAKSNNYYYCINTGINISILTEENCVFDTLHYRAGNYFKTIEQAGIAAKMIRDLLEKFHKDQIKGESMRGEEYF